MCEAEVGAKAINKGIPSDKVWGDAGIYHVEVTPKDVLPR